MYLKLWVLIDSGIHLALKTSLHSLPPDTVELLSSSPSGVLQRKVLCLAHAETVKDKRKEKKLFGAMCELPSSFTSWITTSPMRFPMHYWAACGGKGREGWCPLTHACFHLTFHKEVRKGKLGKPNLSQCLNTKKKLQVKQPSLICTRSGKRHVWTVGQLVLFSPESKVLSPQRIMS